MKFQDTKSGSGELNNRVIVIDGSYAYEITCFSVCVAYICVRSKNDTRPMQGVRWLVWIRRRETNFYYFGIFWPVLPD